MVKAGAAEVVDVVAEGSVKAGKKKYPLKDASADDVAAGATAKLTLKPKGKKSAKGIAKALRSGGKAKATVEVTLTDGAGNADSEKLKVTLKGKPKKG